jgi:pimeloyl-ACP methyl ester carboxylesterase
MSRTEHNLFASSGSGTLTRRQLLQGLAAVSLWAAAPLRGAAQAGTNPEVRYGATTIPAGIRSRTANANGISFHVLEAGFDPPGRPCVLLVHGFPELAYSWRKIMPPLARAGFHVIAPDQRGYGRSGGTEVRFDDDLAPFTTLNHVRDMLGIVSAFGHRSVAAVVGHDFGSPVAAWCALTRPDVFRSVALMSAPFAGAPTLAFNTVDAPPAAEASGRSVYADLAALPQPRKHYQAYYATRPANENMWHPKQGIHDFIRAYYHFKSADWKGNKPFPLAAFNATELAKLPRYYVMDLDKGMAETVAAAMPSAAEIAACQWLTEGELQVYVSEYARTGFQGGLQSYRIGQDPKWSAELQLFAGRTIDVPSVFISGKSDWGVYQRAGSLDAMTKTACTRMRGVHLLDGAGHWVQQEQPEAVSRLLLEFLQQQEQSKQA